jgi:hypothetical protein
VSSVFLFQGKILWSCPYLGFYVNSMRAVMIIRFYRSLCSTADFTRVCFRSRVMDNQHYDERCC